MKIILKRFFLKNYHDNFFRNFSIYNLTRKLKDFYDQITIFKRDENKKKLLIIFDKTYLEKNRFFSYKKL